MEEVQAFSHIVNDVFNAVHLDSAGNARKILSAWEKVLLSIKPYKTSEETYNPNEGQNLVSHSRVVDLKHGVLLVEADHPGWIAMLQMYKKYILRGMQMYAPDLDIRTLAFRVKGKRANLYAVGESSAPSQEVQRKDLTRKLEKEEHLLENSLVKKDNVQKAGQKKPLPPEIACIFEDLKKSMLTNSE